MRRSLSLKRGREPPPPPVASEGVEFFSCAFDACVAGHGPGEGEEGDGGVVQGSVVEQLSRRLQPLRAATRPKVAPAGNDILEGVAGHDGVEEEHVEEEEEEEEEHGGRVKATAVAASAVRKARRRGSGAGSHAAPSPAPDTPLVGPSPRTGILRFFSKAEPLATRAVGGRSGQGGGGGGSSFTNGGVVVHSNDSTASPAAGGAAVAGGGSGVGPPSRLQAPLGPGVGPCQWHYRFGGPVPESNPCEGGDDDDDDGIVDLTLLGTPADEAGPGAGSVPPTAVSEAGACPCWLSAVLGHDSVRGELKGESDVRQSAYTLHLASMLKQVVLCRGGSTSPSSHGSGGGYPWLFSASEVRMVNQFLALPTGAQGLYARLLNRKGPWFRTQDFLKYSKELLGYRVPGMDSSPGRAQAGQVAVGPSDSPDLPEHADKTEAAAREATQVLLDAGLLIALPATTSQDNLASVLQAVNLCLRAPELRLVAAALAPASTPSSALVSAGALSSVAGAACARSASVPGCVGAATPGTSIGWGRSATIPGGSGGGGGVVVAGVRGLGGGGGPGSVDQLRAVIVAAATGQRTMFGSIMNVSRAVRDAVLRHLMDGAGSGGSGPFSELRGAADRSKGQALARTAASKGLGSSARQSGSKGARLCSDGLTPNGLPPLVRVASPWVALFRRAHRLFYLACSTGAASSGSGSGGADVLSTAPTRHYGQRSGNKEQQEGPDLRVFSVWSSPGLMAVWRKASFAPITLHRSCVVFPTGPHWTAYELGLSLLEELESCISHLVPSHSRAGGGRSPAVDTDAGVEGVGDGGEDEEVEGEREGHPRTPSAPQAVPGRQRLGPTPSPSVTPCGTPAATGANKPQVVTMPSGPRTMASAVFGLELAPLLDQLCGSVAGRASSSNSQLDTVGALACTGFRNLLAAGRCALPPLGDRNDGNHGTDGCDVVLVEDSQGSAGDVICISEGPSPSSTGFVFGSHSGCAPGGAKGPLDTQDPRLPRPVATALRASFCLAAAGVVDADPNPFKQGGRRSCGGGSGGGFGSGEGAGRGGDDRSGSSGGDVGAGATHDLHHAVKPPPMTLVTGTGLPPFLRQFSGGYVCATAAWLCVDVLERNRYYVEAIGMILQLLATPHTPHRRGRWWLRLSLDYAHCGMPVEACAACMDAVEDPAVPPGDLIALQRRLVRLQRHHGMAASALRSRRRRSGGGVVLPTSTSPTNTSPLTTGGSIPCLPRTSPSDSAHPESHVPPFADTIKALAMSPSRMDGTDGSHGSDVVLVVRHGAGADKGSGGATVLKPSTAESPSGTAAEDALVASGRNITLRVCRDVYPDKFPTPGVLGVAPVGKQAKVGSMAGVEGEEVEEEDAEEDIMDDDIVAADVAGADGPGDPLVFVEEHALQHYEENGGWCGLHCEGGPIVTLFGVLMWDVLFLSLPDVFLTRFQDGPLDLDFPQCFYPARLPQLKARLTAIATMTPRALVTDIGGTWRAHKGQACRGVSWNYPLQFLQLLAVCLGGPALAHVCDALCWNHKHFTGGLPDLLLWRIIAPPDAGVRGGKKLPAYCGMGSCEGSHMEAEPSEGGDRGGDVGGEESGGGGNVDDGGDNVEDVDGGDVGGGQAGGAAGGSGSLYPDLSLIPNALYQARFVEVKGPRDRLSDRQRAWLALLNDAGIDTDVCFVKETV